jgi:glycosyltransferase involved in cell wall biosynthesis
LTTVRVQVVVPEGFDDPGQPTGGNIYDRRVCAGLAEAGWDVRVTTVGTVWPAPGGGGGADLASVVAAIPDGETVLIDGLIASPAAAQLLPHVGRIRLTVLLHMPLVTAPQAHHDARALDSERVVLGAAAGVVATSDWTRQQVLTHYAIPASRVHVAQPGVDRVAARPRPVRGHLICVGVLSRHKGQDVLVDALAGLAGRDWQCVLAGPLDRDPDFVRHLRARITRLGYGGRVRLAGVLTGAALSRAYTTADLLVAPSRCETYGMTVTEALAHGLPVLAADVGGLPEALGRTAGGARPGQLVPPGDPAALAAALGDWLGDEGYRRRTRAAARERRPTLRGWDQTAQEIANALTGELPDLDGKMLVGDIASTELTLVIGAPAPQGMAGVSGAGVGIAEGHEAPAGSGRQGYPARLAMGRGVAGAEFAVGVVSPAPERVGADSAGVV